MASQDITMSAHSHDDHHHHHDHHHDDHDHHHSLDAAAATSWVGPDGKKYHTHDGLAPHSHEPLYSPGYFTRRARRLTSRDFKERAFTIGIGGPVGTGKTALMLVLCQALRDKYSIAAVTNDIFTKEDGEFLVKHGALPAERIRAVETGGCIYDLPPEFNTQIMKFCDAYESWTNFCEHVKNDGFGPKTHRRSKSWYKTDVYMLELIFHARARRYDCRVMARAEADFFFIPYYTGLDALRYLYGADVNKSAEHGLRVVQWLRENSESSWLRNGGSDHFVVMGRAAWDFSLSPWRVEGWGTSLLELPAMLNVTSLVLESRPFAWQEQAVPYPTAFHPAGAPSLVHWTSRVRRSPRPFLFAFAGGGGTGVSPNIRRSIRTECSNSSALWTGSSPGLPSSSSSELWSGCSFISCDDGRCDQEPGYVMRAMMKADFCLQPPGDTPTRRATFDGIVAGCIPVFFEKQAAYTQYTWHLPADPKDYSVFINKDDVVFGGLKIGEVLANISRAEVHRMREKVIELIPRVVYRKPEATDVGFKDAFDVAIEGVLQRIKIQRKGITS